MMKIHGLIATQIIKVEAVRAKDLVKSYQTYSLGDGLVSVEAKTTYDSSVWGPSIMEWVGSNGTRDGEEPTNFDKLIAEWEKDPQGGLSIVKHAYSYQEYEAPDEVRGSYSFFKREVKKGRLHGCVVSFI